MLDETFVMNACKEDCCFVARDWAEDVRLAKKKGPQNTVARDYVLPGQYQHPLYSLCFWEADRLFDQIYTGHVYYSSKVRFLILLVIVHTYNSLNYW